MDPDKLAAARARHARGESPTQIARAPGEAAARTGRGPPRFFPLSDPLLPIERVLSTWTATGRPIAVNQAADTALVQARVS
ncbi:MAG: hypothetical protein ACRDPY_43005, partial [Streptosporangiaceae bacterium]